MPSPNLLTTDFHLGETAIFLTQEGEENFLEPFKLTLIGSFIKRRPQISKIREFFQGKFLKGEVIVGTLDQRRLLLRCSSPEIFTYLRSKGTWFIDGCRIRVAKYSVQNFHNSEPQTTPIWTELPGLPVHLFNLEFLFNAARQIGDPITLDNATLQISRPSCARMCIDYPLGNPLPQRIWIQESIGGFWQTLKYERIPIFCNFCSTLGHTISNCRKGKNAATAEWKSSPKWNKNQSCAYDENTSIDLVVLPLHGEMASMNPTPQNSENHVEQMKDKGGDLTVIDTGRNNLDWTSEDIPISMGEKHISVGSIVVFPQVSVEDLRTWTETMPSPMMMFTTGNQESNSNRKTPDYELSGITDCPEIESSVDSVIESATLEKELSVDKKADPKNLGSNHGETLLQDQDHSSSCKNLNSVVSPAPTLEAVLSNAATSASPISVDSSETSLTTDHHFKNPNRKRSKKKFEPNWRHKRIIRKRDKPTWSRETTSLAAKDVLMKQFFQLPKVKPKLIQKLIAITNQYPPFEVG